MEWLIYIIYHFLPNQEIICYNSKVYTQHTLYNLIYKLFFTYLSKKKTPRIYTLIIQSFVALIIMLQYILWGEFIVMLISHVFPYVLVHSQELGHTPTNAHVFPFCKITLIILLSINALGVTLVEYTVELYIQHIKLNVCSFYFDWINSLRAKCIMSVIDKE